MTNEFFDGKIFDSIGFRIKSIKFSKNIKKLADYSFYFTKNCTEFNFPEHLETGNFSFKLCGRKSGLKNSNNILSKMRSVKVLAKENYYLKLNDFLRLEPQKRREYFLNENLKKYSKIERTA